MDADTQAVNHPLPADQVALAVEVFRMFAEGTRIQILWSLIDGEMPVNDLAETIGKPGPSVSQHLAKLRMARLVRHPPGGHHDLLPAGERPRSTADHRRSSQRRARRPSSSHLRRTPSGRGPCERRGASSDRTPRPAPAPADTHDHRPRRGMVTGCAAVFRPHSHDSADSVDSALEGSARASGRSRSAWSRSAPPRCCSSAWSPSAGRWRCSPTPCTTSPTR